jgi:hypothetical protein
VKTWNGWNMATKAGGVHMRLDELAVERAYSALGVLPNYRDLVVGPYDYWSLAKIRKQIGHETGTSCPTDVFIWAVGADQDMHPAMTKLGGRPFLPQNVPWPTRAGVAGTFYAQINFEDSKDIIGDVPGDLLLVFKFYNERWTSWQRELYEFVWVKRKDGEECGMRNEVPSGGLDTDPEMYGVRVRTVDDMGWLEKVRQAKGGGRWHIVTATKIGGIPTDKQSVWPPELGEGMEFLAQVAAVYPPAGVAWPLLGWESKVDYGSPEVKQLVHGPGSGVLCIMKNRTGGIEVFFSDS